jgi:hypothetical protein
MLSAKDGTFKLDIFELLFESEKPHHYDKNYDDPALLNPSLCAECGGACCKRCGCFFSPDDFADLSFEGMKAEIDKGYIVIEAVDLDQYNMDGFAYIVRARNVGDPVYIGSLTHRPEAPCVMLGENGCKFDWEHRPAGGRLLKPVKGARCETDYGICETVREWRAHQRLLNELVDYYRRRKDVATP